MNWGVTSLNETKYMYCRCLISMLHACTRIAGAKNIRATLFEPHRMPNYNKI